jgi:hypothetical protein
MRPTKLSSLSININPSLKVDLNLSLAEGGEPLPAAALFIANQDPKPTVNLTNIGQTVAEGAGTVNLTATLSQATPLPVNANPGAVTTDTVTIQDND